MARSLFPESSSVESILGFIEAHPPGQEVLSDTSAIIYLAKVNLLPILASAYQVMVAPAVVNELSLDMSAAFPETRLIANLLAIGHLSVESPDRAVGKEWVTVAAPGAGGSALHGGEAQIALLAQDLHSGFVLTDDHLLIRHCRYTSIPYSSTILIPALMLRHGLINRSLARDSFDRVSSIGFFSPGVRQVADTILQVFERQVAE